MQTQCTLLLGTPALGGKLFFWVFLLPFLFPSSGVLTADPRSALSSLWLCSFHLHNWLSPRAFIHADKSFWHVHGVCTARARLGARRSAAFSKTARLGQPAQPPHAGFIFFFGARTSLLALPPLARVTVPALPLLPQRGAKLPAAGGRSNVTFIAGLQGRQRETREVDGVISAPCLCYRAG